MTVVGRQDGQSMAEFALVLPMLALLTFGTIEVGIYLQQQSLLNAAGYIAARSASVLANEVTPTRESTMKFARMAGPAWLGDAVSAMHSASTKDASVFKLQSKTDLLTGLISGLTDNKAKGLDTLAAVGTLPLEYDYRKAHQTHVTGVARTFSLVTYDSNPKSLRGNLAVLDTAPAGIARIIAAVKPLAVTLHFTIPPKVPTGGGGNNPGPGPRPRPHAGASPGPRPKPGPRPNPGPGPRPKPVQPLQVALDVPGAAYIAGMPPPANNLEPFHRGGAVVPNPKHRNDRNDGGQVTSAQYTRADWENSVKPNPTDEEYKLKNIMDGLAKYEAMLTGQNLAGGKTAAGRAAAGMADELLKNGVLLGTYVPEKDPRLQAAMQANPAATRLIIDKLNRELAVARNNARTWGGAMRKGPQTAYRTMDQYERTVLFRP